MATVVSFINYKGGVGKTTISVEMAASLAHHKKKKVLLADLDPQTNATFYLITPEDWQNWADKNGTLKNIFSSASADPPQPFNPKDAILPNVLKAKTGEIVTLDLLPSHLELMAADMDLAMRFGARGLEGRKILRAAFDKVKDNYDYIICDCPPNLNLITQNAILASDAMIVVAMSEYLSTIGISEIEKAVSRLVVDVNKSLGGFCNIVGPKLKGIIFNRVTTQNGGTDYEKKMREQVQKKWPGLVFENFVSQSTKISASASPTRSPIAISGYSADSVYEKQLKDCATEFILRIER